jgi:hypothetical protein
VTDNALPDTAVGRRLARSAKSRPCQPSRRGCHERIDGPLHRPRVAGADVRRDCQAIEPAERLHAPRIEPDVACVKDSPANGTSGTMSIGIFGPMGGW